MGHIGNGATVEIDNPDPNGLGEVLNHGRNVFMGYHKEEEKTREVFTEDNYYRTGDLGKFDDNGYLVSSPLHFFRVFFLCTNLQV